MKLTDDQFRDLEVRVGDEVFERAEKGDPDAKRAIEKARDAILANADRHQKTHQMQRVLDDGNFEWDIVRDKLDANKLGNDLVKVAQDNGYALSKNWIGSRFYNIGSEKGFLNQIWRDSDMKTEDMFREVLKGPDSWWKSTVQDLIREQLSSEIETRREVVDTYGEESDALNTSKAQAFSEAQLKRQAEEKWNWFPQEMHKNEEGKVITNQKEFNTYLDHLQTHDPFAYNQWESLDTTEEKSEYLLELKEQDTEMYKRLQALQEKGGDAYADPEVFDWFSRRGMIQEAPSDWGAALKGGFDVLGQAASGVPGLFKQVPFDLMRANVAGVAGGVAGIFGKGKGLREFAKEQYQEAGEVLGATKRTLAGDFQILAAGATGLAEDFIEDVKLDDDTPEGREAIRKFKQENYRQYILKARENQAMWESVSFDLSSKFWKSPQAMEKIVLAGTFILDPTNAADLVSLGGASAVKQGAKAAAKMQARVASRGSVKTLKSQVDDMIVNAAKANDDYIKVSQREGVQSQAASTAKQAALDATQNLNQAQAKLSDEVLKVTTELEEIAAAGKLRMSGKVLEGLGKAGEKILDVADDLIHRAASAVTRSSETHAGLETVLRGAVGFGVGGPLGGVLAATSNPILRSFLRDLQKVGAYTALGTRMTQTHRALRFSDEVAGETIRDSVSKPTQMLLNMVEMPAALLNLPGIRHVARAPGLAANAVFSVQGAKSIGLQAGLGYVGSYGEMEGAISGLGIGVGMAASFGAGSTFLPVVDKAHLWKIASQNNRHFKKMIEGTPMAQEFDKLSHSEQTMVSWSMGGFPDTGIRVIDDAGKTGAWFDRNAQEIVLNKGYKGWQEEFIKEVMKHESSHFLASHPGIRTKMMNTLLGDIQTGRAGVLAKANSDGKLKTVLDQVTIDTIKHNQQNGFSDSVIAKGLGLSEIAVQTHGDKLTAADLRRGDVSFEMSDEFNGWVQQYMDLIKANDTAAFDTLDQMRQNNTREFQEYMIEEFFAEQGAAGNSKDLSWKELGKYRQAVWKKGLDKLYNSEEGKLLKAKQMGRLGAALDKAGIIKSSIFGEIPVVKPIQAIFDGYAKDRSMGIKLERDNSDSLETILDTASDRDPAEVDATLKEYARGGTLNVDPQTGIPKGVTVQPDGTWKVTDRSQVYRNAKQVEEEAKAFGKAIIDWAEDNAPPRQSGQDLAQSLDQQVPAQTPEQRGAFSRIEAEMVKPGIEKTDVKRLIQQEKATSQQPATTDYLRQVDDFVNQNMPDPGQMAWRKTIDGKWLFSGKYMSDALIDHLEQSGQWNPHQIENLRLLNEHLQTDSHQIPITVMYQAALKGGKYKPRRATERNVYVTGFHITEQGNLVYGTWNLDKALANGAKKLRSKAGKKLYGNDINELGQDIRQFFNNHANGMPGATRLSVEKRDFIRKLIGLGDPKTGEVGLQAGRIVNPYNYTLNSLADAKDSVFGTYRIDRTNWMDFNTPRNVDKALDRPLTSREEGQGGSYQRIRENYYPGVDTPTPDGGIVRKFSDGTEITQGMHYFPGTVYHGTGHTVDEFSTRRIGDGEGVQAFGWGLYFTQNINIGKDYANRLSIRQRTWKGEEIPGSIYRGDPTPAVANLVDDATQFILENFPWYKDGDNLHPLINASLFSPIEIFGSNEWEKLVNKAKSEFQQYKNDLEKWEAGEIKKRPYRDLVDEVTLLTDHLSGNYRVERKASLYEVKIHPEEETFLNWDKTFSEQSQFVQDALTELAGDDINQIRYLRGDPRNIELTGMGIYSQLKQQAKQTAGPFTALRDLGVSKSAMETSIKLEEYGIKGVMYLDGVSRKKGEGSHNLVVFNDRDIEIISRDERSGTNVRFHPGVDDARYMELVKDPNADKTELRTLVEAAAKQAGYDTSRIVYRGDEMPFNVLMAGEESGNLGRGLYFTPDRYYARRYGNPREFYLRGKIADIQSPEVLPRYESILKELEEFGEDPDLVFSELAEELGVDGFSAKGVGGFSFGAEEIVVPEGSFAKSAALEVRDDAGNIIPLSERFNLQSDDIRYSPGSEPHDVRGGLFSPTRRMLHKLFKPGKRYGAEEIRAKLQKDKAVREDMVWIGMDEFLDTKKSFDFFELLKHVDENRLELEEVVYEGLDPAAMRESVEDDVIESEWSNFPYQPTEYYGYFDQGDSPLNNDDPLIQTTTREDLEAEVREYEGLGEDDELSWDIQDAMHNYWILEDWNQTSYNDIMYDSESEASNALWESISDDIRYLSDEEFMERYGDPDYRDEESAAKYRQYMNTTPLDNYREVVLKTPRVHDFESSHFDQDSGYVGHMLLSDQVVVPGSDPIPFDGRTNEKTLHIEEGQNDASTEITAGIEDLLNPSQIMRREEEYADWTVRRNALQGRLADRTNELLSDPSQIEVDLDITEFTTGKKRGLRTAFKSIDRNGVIRDHEQWIYQEIDKVTISGMGSGDPKYENGSDLFIPWGAEFLKDFVQMRAKNPDDPWLNAFIFGMGGVEFRGRFEISGPPKAREIKLEAIKSLLKDHVKNAPEGSEIRYKLNQAAAIQQSAFEFEEVAQKIVEDKPEMNYTAEPPFMRKMGHLRLILKKAILRAIAEGKDGISWVRGEEVQERYGLQHKLSAMTITKRDNGRYDIVPETIGRGRMEAPELTNVTKKQADESIGAGFIDELEASGETSKRFEGSGLGMKKDWPIKLYNQSFHFAASDVIKQIAKSYRESNPLDDFNVKTEMKVREVQIPGRKIQGKDMGLLYPYIPIPNKIRDHVRSTGLPMFHPGIDDGHYLDLAKDTKKNATQMENLLRSAAIHAGAIHKDDPIVYHGTGTKITKFNPDLTGKQHDQYGSGFYFTTDRKEAEAYMKTSKVQDLRTGELIEKLGGYDSPGVINAFVSLKNPIRIAGRGLRDADVNITKSQAAEIIRKSIDIMDPDESTLGDWFAEFWIEGPQDWMIEKVAENYTGNSLISLENDWFRNDATGYRHALKDVLGYDGVVQTFEDGKQYMVAWFPEQIKSAELVTRDDAGNIIPPSKRFDSSNDDIRYSPGEYHPAASDKEYLQMANDPNTPLREIKEVVDYNARLNGYYYGSAFHGSAEKFFKFDKEKLGETTKAPSAKKAFFFAGNKSVSEGFRDLAVSKKRDQNILAAWEKKRAQFDAAFDRIWTDDFKLKMIELVRKDKGKNTHESLIDMINEEDAKTWSPMILSYLERISDDPNIALLNKYSEEMWELSPDRYHSKEIMEKYTPEGHVGEFYLQMFNPHIEDHAGHRGDKSFAEIIETAKNNGHDGVILRNTNELGAVTDVLAVFEPSQIKSADPITYDENGNVIPLSQRFNQQSDDIRYNPGVGERIPELEDAAKKLQSGSLSKEEYSNLVDKYKPVRPYASVPQPATMEEMRWALNSNQLKKLGKGHEISEGQDVGLRLDINAYTRKGVWIPTIHHKSGKTIAHESVAMLTDGVFADSGEKALRVAVGANKAPFAVIKGKWKPVTPDQAESIAQTALSDNSWTQVGFDPTRHSYFYDRKNHRSQVVSADEVIQIGPLVLAKNAQTKALTNQSTDIRFSPGVDPGVDPRVVDGREKVKNTDFDKPRKYLLDEGISAQSAGVVWKDSDARLMLKKPGLQDVVIKAKVNKDGKESESLLSVPVADIFPNINIGKRKTSAGKKVNNPDHAKRLLDVGKKMRSLVQKDPGKGSSQKGYAEFMKSSGVAADIAMRPEIVDVLLNKPNLAEDMFLNKGIHGDLTIETRTNAISGLDGTVDFRKQIGEGEAPHPFVAASLMLWGVLSKRATPLNQEGFWLRLMAEPKILEAIQSSIDGGYALDKNGWKALVNKVFEDTKDVIHGNAVKANANGMHNTLDRLNGRWDEFANVFATKDAMEMRSRFWKVIGDVGPLEIANKVLSFQGLTLGIPSWVGDRWQYVMMHYPYLLKTRNAKLGKDYFKYNQHQVPIDPAGTYDAYGNVIESNRAYSHALYEYMNAMIDEAIKNEPDIYERILGKHTNAGGFHWVSWNAIKNEPVGHSSLSLLYDLQKDASAGNIKTIEDIKSSILNNTTYTEGRVSGENQKVHFKQGKIERGK